MDAPVMQHHEVKMYNPSQLSLLHSSGSVFAKIRLATEMYFQRRLDGDAPSVTSPGLEVTESTWGEWEEAMNRNGHPGVELKGKLN